MSIAVVSGTVLSLVGITYWIWKKLKSHDTTCLRDKVVVITGASSGLGEACAKMFYQVGSKVVLCARRKNELERVKKLLLDIELKPGTPHHEPQVVVLDVGDFASIQQKVDEIVSVQQSVDILVNNAGISSRGEVINTSLDVFIKLINVNYLGQVAMTKAVLPIMIRQKSGHIINISSIQGKISIPHRSPYAASKHALQAFCDSLRAEVSHLGIHVTVLCPGYIKTNLSLNALQEDGSKYGATDSSTGHGMTPDEVAMCIIQAACDQTKEQLIGQFLFKLAIYLRNILPDVYFSIMAAKAVKERNKLLKAK